MSARDRLLREMYEVPESIVDEILDFVAFLKAKHAREFLDTAVASEPVLARDWLMPEEEEAWKDL